MYASHNDVIEFASSREISNEIAEAILEMAQDADEAQAIWEAPSTAQHAAVISRAWELSGEGEDELFWGGKITR